MIGRELALDTHGREEEGRRRRRRRVLTGSNA